MKTCVHCNYDMEHCICGKKRNMAGDVEKFGNYSDWKDRKNMFAMTTPRMYQRDSEEHKYFEEILPLDKEKLDIWIRRTAQHTVKLTDYARYQHIYGTKRTWSCHDSSRYCFICTLCDFVDILRCLAVSIMEKFPDTPLIWSISLSEDGRSEYHII